MKYYIKGSDAKTGKDRTLLIDANSETTAVAAATAKGVTPISVTPMLSNKTASSTTTTAARSAAQTEHENTKKPQPKTPPAMQLIEFPRCPKCGGRGYLSDGVGRPRTNCTNCDGTGTVGSGGREKWQQTEPPDGYDKWSFCQGQYLAASRVQQAAGMMMRVWFIFHRRADGSLDQLPGDWGQGCTVPYSDPDEATIATALRHVEGMIARQMATGSTTLYAFFVHAEARTWGTVVDTASNEKWVAGIRQRANWPDSPVRIVREKDWNPPKLPSLAQQHIVGTLQRAVADGIPKYLASQGVRQMSAEQVANNSLGCIENPTTGLLIILIKA